MTFAWIRECYEFPARLYPGGPVATLAWYWAPDDASEYMEEHSFMPMAELLQCSNTIDDPNNVGELTPADYTPTGRRKARSLRTRKVKRQHRFKAGETLLVDGTEVHGTPAAFNCEPESDGTYSVKIWDPADTITREEYDALPECIRLNHENPFVLKLISRAGSRGELVAATAEVLVSRAGSRGELVAATAEVLVSRAGSRGELVAATAEVLVSRAGSRGELVQPEVGILISLAGSRGELIAVTSYEVGSETGTQGGCVVYDLVGVGGETGTQGGADLVDVLEVGSETGTQGMCLEPIPAGSETGTQGGAELVDVLDAGADLGTQGGAIVWDGFGTGTDGGCVSLVPLEVGSETGTQGGVDIGP